jgi:glycosyltransferase involved in cell wall biosynthesis
LEAARLGVADRVRFTGHRSDIVALLGLLDCLVLCSRWEALPVTLLEAMAAGTPCVSTDVGGCGDLVRSGETGWLVPPADVEALSRAVQACLAGGEEVKSIASRAREFVTRHHSIEQVARDHEALYEAVLREKGGRQRAV